MDIPTTLKHKPVLLVKAYDAIDGRYAGHSDAKGLSIGLAQWNDRGRVDVSAKVWRYTGEKWSRQSEEMPLHRVLDLALLIVEAKRYFQNAYRFEKLYDPETPAIATEALQGGKMAVSVCVENPNIDEDIRLTLDAISRDDELLSERLHRLSDLLWEAGYGSRRDASLTPSKRSPLQTRGADGGTHAGE